MVMLWRWPVERRENYHVRGGRWSLMEGEWSCYGGGQLNGGSMFVLHSWSV